MRENHHRLGAPAPAPYRQTLASVPLILHTEEAQSPGFLPAGQSLYFIYSPEISTLSKGPEFGK